MTDWTKNPIVPRGDLYAWHQYEAGVSADGVANDYSGSIRHYTTASNKSVLTLITPVGQPGWYFNGSRDPMLWNSTVMFKHVFMLVSAEEATFAGYRGLLSDTSAITLLVGNDTTDKFTDLSGSFTSEYRKSDVVFAASTQKAPMSQQAAVIELQIPAAITMNALQLGKQTNISGPTRLWKGYFYDDLIYSAIKNDAERQRIYEYYAMRYQVWSKNAAGLYIYPFAANKTRSLDFDQEHFLSTPYSGDPKALVRGAFKGAYGLQYLLREQAEWDATQAFFKQHAPIAPFVIRDYRYYPYREVKVRFASSLKEQGSDVTYRFNYTFDVVEVT